MRTDSFIYSLLIRKNVATDNMTDLEMLQLTAQAMGFESWIHESDTVWALDKSKEVEVLYLWNPLVSDAQAMMLCKRFMLDVDFFAGSAMLPTCSTSFPPPDHKPNRCEAYSDESINRAIVQCIATLKKMG